MLAEGEFPMTEDEMNAYEDTGPWSIEERKKLCEEAGAEWEYCLLNPDCLNPPICVNASKGTAGSS